MLQEFLSFFQIFNFEFAQIAFIAIILITIMCGTLSPVVVLKQRAYLGDTLSHLVFPGVIVGIVVAKLTLLPFWGCILIGSIATALIGTFLAEWILKTLKIPPDASAVICLTSFFAMGIIAISNAKDTRIDPESILFGDVLTLSWLDVLVLAITLVCVLISIIFLRKHWDAWLSDPEFAEIAGFKVKLLEKLFPVLMTAAILSGLFAVGGLMISSLLTLPTIIYQPRSVFSPIVVLLSLIGGILGFLLAFSFNWPVGPSIVILGFFSIIVKTLSVQIREK
ncbi:metal ABC transporter permease [Pigmentibacter sp. JX0631]|uniref:metal ABC transporter permease n=1 Tax=Pigmentibacter sp. JX0631 TaxID=2976982 RepID=UPI002468C113|nr:metal ABC transporter permease [Pigmentibacter sp. JX0631]WGL60166.1 metal ABC transporter permease [Pigmentibacter sp. JX0631]